MMLCIISQSNMSCLGYLQICFGLTPFLASLVPGVLSFTAFCGPTDDALHIYLYHGTAGSLWLTQVLRLMLLAFTSATP